MDLYHKLERALRTPPERLPVDELLPPPDRIPSSLPEGAGSSHATSRNAPEGPVDDGGGGPRMNPPGPQEASLVDPEGDEEDLQAEIQEFLKRQREDGHHDQSPWGEEPDAQGNGPEGVPGEGSETPG